MAETRHGRQRRGEEEAPYEAARRRNRTGPGRGQQSPSSLPRRADPVRQLVRVAEAGDGLALGLLGGEAFRHETGGRLREVAS